MSRGFGKILTVMLFVIVFARAEARMAKPRRDSNVIPAAQDSLIATTKDGGMLSPARELKENWTTPSLAGSDLTRNEALTLDSYTGPDFSRELVRVSWRSEDGIDLYIIKPAGVKKPPVILYLYSYPADSDRFRDDSFCKFLARHGFAAVGFVSALTGQRYHNRPMKEWFVSELQEALATSAHDVQMILNYLAERGEFDMNRIGMFGDGSGATIAILAAATDRRIKALDLLDPWGDWPEWVAKSSRIPEAERPDYLSKDFLAKVAPLDPVLWLQGLKTPKVRIQQIGDLTVTPGQVRRKIEAAKPRQAQVVHYEHTADFVKAVSNGRGFDWLKQQLQAPSSPHNRVSGEFKKPGARFAGQAAP